jgi:dipeptidyl aminopeptidase/acylaminoacyl peptidase
MGDYFTGAYEQRVISSLFHASNITRLLMVIQRANDPVYTTRKQKTRCFCKANGVPVECVLFDDKGHGFSKKIVLPPLASILST